MKRLPILLVVVALSVVVVREFQYAGARKDWQNWAKDTTRLLADLNVNRSQRLILQRERDSLETLANRLLATANRQYSKIQEYRGVADSLRGVLTTAPDASDSAQVALRLAETYRVALDSAQEESSLLRAYIALRDSQMVRLTQSEALGWRSADSLAALIRRTPKHGCKRLFGVPLPQLGVGYGLTTKGMGPVVALTIPISGCR